MQKTFKSTIILLILLFFFCFTPKTAKAYRLYRSPYWWGTSIGFYSPYVWGGLRFGYGPYFGFGGYYPISYYGMYNASRPSVRHLVPNPVNEARWNRRLARLSQEKMERYFAMKEPVPLDFDEVKETEEIKINIDKDTPKIKINNPNGEFTPKETQIIENGTVVMNVY